MVTLYSWLLAGLFVAFSAWLIPLLHDSTSTTVAALVGIAIAWIIPASAGRGSTTAVDEHGIVHFGFGAQPSLSFPLTAASNLHPVAGGLVRGTGLIIDPQAVTFHHRKGLSFATMRRYRQLCDVDLVLEFTSADDCRHLNELLAQLRADLPADKSGT
jgi:hypothetical protein